MVDGHTVMLDTFKPIRCMDLVCSNQCSQSRCDIAETHLEDLQGTRRASFLNSEQPNTQLEGKQRAGSAFIVFSDHLQLGDLACNGFGRRLLALQLGKVTSVLTQSISTLWSLELLHTHRCEHATLVEFVSSCLHLGVAQLGQIFTGPANRVWQERLRNPRLAGDCHRDADWSTLNCYNAVEDFSCLFLTTFASGFLRLMRHFRCPNRVSFAPASLPAYCCQRAHHHSRLPHRCQRRLHPAAHRCSSLVAPSSRRRSPQPQVCRFEACVSHTRPRLLRPSRFRLTSPNSYCETSGAIGRQSSRSCCEPSASHALIAY